MCTSSSGLVRCSVAFVELAFVELAFVELAYVALVRAKVSLLGEISPTLEPFSRNC